MFAPRYITSMNQSYIIRCTDASDYAIGILIPKGQNSPDAIEQTIRFLNKTLTPVQSRSPTIEQEVYAINYSLQILEDLLGVDNTHSEQTIIIYYS